MQLIGAHMSIAGGVDKAIDRAEQLGCTAFQIFLKQPRKLFDKPLSEQEIENWHAKLSASAIVKKVVAHTGYLINLAAPDDEKWERYIQAMADEMSRADALGIENLVLHPGSSNIPSDIGAEWGIKRVAAAIDRLYSEHDFAVNIALEIVAGGGTKIGSTFEELAAIIDASKFGHKLRITFDTCHAFAAGYDFGTEEKYHRMWQQFDEILGRERLVCIHMNDSKHPFNSKKDRHEHIGKGFLGIEPFRLIMQDSSLAEIPKILETPKKNDMDRVNLKLLWELAGETPPVEL